MTEITVIADRYAYVVVALLLAVGLYTLSDPHLLKKVLGLNLFQTGIFLFFITASYRAGGQPPIVDGSGPYVNPLPHVLILTAIVVGVSVTAIALALLIQVHRTYGTLRTDELREAMADG
ncbi:sodium:proton antiporter [Haloarcula marina]|uniref:sodium:proton antiporter n=1 Tax=Haloarcula marina TaxID=2961574 RepID=UPI0020B717DB|nr:cation:proton antiporter subunit C [Halomicroarcula marina]